MAKLHYQKLASSPPGKLEHPSNPPPPIFPGKKLWIRAWYPMQMSHVTNCFYTKIAVFPFKLLSLINLEYNHMYLQIRKLSVNALLAV